MAKRQPNQREEAVQAGERVSGKDGLPLVVIGQGLRRAEAKVYVLILTEIKSSTVFRAQSSLASANASGDNRRKSISKGGSVLW